MFHVVVFLGWLWVVVGSWRMCKFLVFFSSSGLFRIDNLIFDYSRLSRLVEVVFLSFQVVPIHVELSRLFCVWAVCSYH